MGNILNHNRLPFDFILNRSEYWDFFLSLPEYGSTCWNVNDRCLISFIDTTDPNCIGFDKLYSKPDCFWQESVNNGLTLKNIGYTGVDNGLVSFQKDRTSNEQFLKLFMESQYTVNEGDIRLTLTKIGGNNQIFSYDNDIVEEDGMIVSRLNGGFYQGFFKATNDYSVLPTNFDNGITFEVVLKKHDFENDSKYRLNDKHSGNKGIFLYIGTRAENKWLKYYNVENGNKTEENGYVVDGYVKSEYLDSDSLNSDYLKPYHDLYAVSEYFSDGYLTEKCADCCCDTLKKDEDIPKSTGKIKFTYPEALNVYEDNSVWFDEDGHLWVENERLSTGRHSNSCHVRKRKCDCGKYFSDNYINDEYYSDCDCTMYVNDEYIKPEVKIDINGDLETFEGRDVRQPNVREYVTDNKFLLFDRTCDGFTTETWVEGTNAIISDITIPDEENLFLLFDRTCSGYTVETYEKRMKEKSKKYDILSDLYRNAMSFQITDDGKIGYNLFVKDCDSESGYSILSEWSNPNVIKEDTWHTVTIRIMPLQEEYSKCNVDYNDNAKMVIYVYVDGKLRLVSKDIPSLRLRELNDFYDKQEAVPYNISLGGGTQGLCDVIYLNFRELPSNLLPLEESFGGTFIGYIKALRIYKCAITLSEIRQNGDIKNFLV